jgi:Protein of unknown function (DUF3047)
LRRLVLLLIFLGLILLAHSAQISMMLLNIPSPSAGKLPDGWTVKVNHGTPEIATGSGPEGAFVQLRSHKSSYSLERGVDVDLAQYPYLSWRWRVSELPAGGDFRRAATDDQAAQVLVAFQDRRVLTYIWDTTAPKGMMASSSSIPLVHIVAFVCESGSQHLNQWISEARNLAQDYEKAYGRRTPHVKGIRLQINSQHTGTSAESQFAEVTFRSTPQ